MTLTADDRATLARRARNRDEVTTGTLRGIMRSITYRDLVPFRDDLDAFTRRGHTDDDAYGPTWAHMRQILPEHADLDTHGFIAQYDIGLPMFFAWLDDSRRTVTYWRHLPDEDPRFRDIDRVWLETLHADYDRWRAAEHGSATAGTTGIWDAVAANPGAYTSYLKRFFAWLIDNPAVPSGDTVTTPDQTRTIEFWNALTRTSHWAPYRDDLVAYIPQSQFRGWAPLEIDCILGLPYGPTNTVARSFLTEDEDATPGNGRRHPYLDQFARAVVDGTYTLITARPPVTTTTTEEPTVTALLTPALINTPVNLWPRPVREAAAEEIARYFVERSINDNLERARRNSNYALLFEDAGAHNTWRDSEFHVHTRFRNEVRDGTFITPLTRPGTAPGTVPSGDTTPTLPVQVTAFMRVYAGLPDIAPTGSVSHGYTSADYETRTESAQTAFLAMPAEYRDHWQGLYEEARRREHEVNLAGVAWTHARVNAYGHSTENFFRWCRRRGVTIDPTGTPVDPQGVTTTTTEEPTVPTTRFDLDTITTDEFDANRYTYTALLTRGTLNRYMDQDSGTTRSFLVNHLVDPHHEEDRWSSLAANIRTRHSHRFLNWARANRDTLEWVGTAPTPTPTVETGGRVIPIGPEHPGWQAFAQRLAETATANSMCPEYDRIARNVGLPTRKERVMYRIVLDVPVEVERGANADIRSLRTAAATALETATASGTRRLESSRSQTVG